MRGIELAAPAKINFALDVTGKRPDGYHNVRMVMQSVSLADTVYMKKVSGAAAVTSDIGGIPLDGRNLALKAWDLMRSRFDLPGGVNIHLEKRIPVEAGLAGGSTDAAAVLRGINILFELGLDVGELADLGVKLGADVPFCVFGGTALAEGIGEILTPLPTPPEIWIVLVNPGFGVSTAQVYQGFDGIPTPKHPDVAAMVHAVMAGSRKGIKDNLGNVLESVTFKMHPELEDLKIGLCKMDLFPLMSGSGPSFFALAETEEKARAAAAELRGRWKFAVAVCTI